MMEALLILHSPYLCSFGNEFKRLVTCGGGGGSAHKQETGTQNASPDFQPQEKGFGGEREGENTTHDKR